MISQVFVERPRLAAVVSIVLVVAGILALRAIPVAQYPPITPPVVVVTATYPGADAQTIADTVGGPIEEQVNGVQDMLYMSSTASSSGSYSLTVPFAVATPPAIPPVPHQHRVSHALSPAPHGAPPLGRSGPADS
ncbi:efflux RND transporter permease subunit, partial [Thiohalocapsa sp.]|uniref:efflux RND transporter permease subunit n=1 Tax=Thiohalocapsa sp. TaxID=2497641 RepID=UPI0025D06C9B